MADGSRCPKCNMAATGAEGIMQGEARAPLPGDFSVCVNCGTVLRFDEDLKLVESSLVDAFMELPWDAYEPLKRYASVIQYSRRKR